MYILHHALSLANGSQRCPFVAPKLDTMATQLSVSSASGLLSQTKPHSLQLLLLPVWVQRRGSCTNMVEQSLLICLVVWTLGVHSRWQRDLAMERFKIWTIAAVTLTVVTMYNQKWIDDMEVTMWLHYKSGRVDNRQYHPEVHSLLQRSFWPFICRTNSSMAVVFLWFHCIIFQFFNFYFDIYL